MLHAARQSKERPLMLGSMIRAPPSYKHVPDYGWAMMDSIVIVNGLLRATAYDRFLAKLAECSSVTSSVKCLRLEPHAVTLVRAILVMKSSEEAKAAAAVIRNIRVTEEQQKKLHVQHFAYRRDHYTALGYFTPNVGTYMLLFSSSPHWRD
jgi:hypothetical protein